MRSMRVWLTRLGEFVLKRRRDAELAAEMESHLQMHIEDSVRSGLAPDEARRRALIALGGIEQTQENYRDRRGFPALEAVIQDVRFGFRMLRKNPGFTAVAVLTLALGIGATTAIFTLVHAVLLNSLPVTKPGELYRVGDVEQCCNTGSLQDNWSLFSYDQYKYFRDNTPGFDELAALQAGTEMVGVRPAKGSQPAQSMRIEFVSGNYFATFGIGAYAGRILAPEDDHKGAPAVAVISYSTWQEAFGADPSVVGGAFTINNQPFTIIGIAPPAFFGDRLTNFVALWIPISDQPFIHPTYPLTEWPQQYWLDVIGRISPGADPKQIASTCKWSCGNGCLVLNGKTWKVTPFVPKQTLHLSPGGAGIRMLRDQYISGLHLLMWISALVLAIASINVANLMLVRATARKAQTSIKSALGAPVSRQMQQALIESVVLALVGGLAGLAVAFVHAVRGNLNERLMGSGKAVGSSSGHGRLRSILVVAEVALSIVLLVGAGMAMRSLFAMQDVDLGFNPTNIMTARVNFPPGRNNTAEQKRAFFQQVLTRVTALPGVKGAAVALSRPPYAGMGSEITVPNKTHTDRWNSLMELCSPAYFSTLGANVLQGRMLSDEDIDTARRVAVINEQFARNYFPNEDPIGKTVKFNALDRMPDAPHDAYFEIVGLVRNIRNQGVKDSPQPQAYVPYTITGALPRMVLVRTTANPLAMLPSVRREISAVDSGVPLTQTGSIESFLEQSTYAGPEFSLIMMGATAGVGLVLVVIGVFSVMAYSVSLQTHDIGLRMALGAQQRDVLRVVISQGGRLIGLGILVGLVASFVLARYISSQFWGVSVTDPLTYVAVASIVVVTGLVACLLPARKASEVDPLVALRYE